MKKLILLLVIFFGYSCSPTLFISPTINLPLYSKSNNTKELIRSKYGNPSKVENQVKQEIWIYDYSSSFKSNRTVIFDNNGKIITNKKHYKTFHMVTGFNKYGYITIGAILLIFTITGPFPALL